MIPAQRKYFAMAIEQDDAMLPRAILFDLDDTLIHAYQAAEAAWLVVATELADELVPLTPIEVAVAVSAAAQKF